MIVDTNKTDLDLISEIGSILLYLDDQNILIAQMESYYDQI